jgi:transposase-like protein
MDKRKLRRKRTFSEEIRRKAVKEFRSGKYTAQELSDLYHCSSTTIYRWIYKYSPADQPKLNVVQMADSSDKKLKELQQQITDLQAALGRKQIQVDFYEKMADLAKSEYGIDLKKNFSTQPLSGSGKTGKS